MSVQPRLLRPKDAWVYLGVNRNFFNQHVRPSLTDVRFGKQSVAFDRNELDAWADNAVKKAQVVKLGVSAEPLARTRRG